MPNPDSTPVYFTQGDGHVVVCPTASTMNGWHEKLNVMNSMAVDEQIHHRLPTTKSRDQYMEDLLNKMFAIKAFDPVVGRVVMSSGTGRTNGNHSCMDWAAFIATQQQNGKFSDGLDALSNVCPYYYSLPCRSLVSRFLMLGLRV